MWQSEDKIKSRVTEKRWITYLTILSKYLAAQGLQKDKTYWELQRPESCEELRSPSSWKYTTQRKRRIIITNGSAVWRTGNGYWLPNWNWLLKFELTYNVSINNKNTNALPNFVPSLFDNFKLSLLERSFIFYNFCCSQLSSLYFCSFGAFSFSPFGQVCLKFPIFLFL